jgi:hypothetical protein
MYITMSDLLGRVKSKLGSSVRKLELSDDDMIRLFTEDTLKTLSIFFPRKIDHVINTIDESVGGARSRFFLNTPHEIIRVAQIIPGNPGSVAGLYIDGKGIVYGSVIDTQPLKDIQSFYETPQTFEFIPPNQVEVSPMPAMGTRFMSFVLHVKHDSTATLPPGLRESVMKLFEYDVKIDLLGIRKYFQSISTTFGELQLSTDTLESAQDKRDELIELFSAKKMRNSNAQKVWVY